jgi:mannose-6-phosphate isomerase
LVARHDSDALVASLQRREVRTGDAIVVPAGVPHAIDAGILVLELQEPTDLSVLLEWDGFAVDGDRDGHLGLGYPTVVEALRRDPLPADELAGLVRSTGLTGGEARSIFPPAADGYFRADLLPGRGAVAPGFAIALVVDGSGELRFTDADVLTVARGDAVVIPWAAGRWEAAGADVVACRPPLPAAAADAR